MTAAAPQKSGSFGRILKSELESQNVKTRELARRLAPTPDKVESKRRLLHQYLCGKVSPGPEMRDLIAEALGIDAAVFTEDAERQAEHERLMVAFESVADILLDIARKAAE